MSALQGFLADLHLDELRPLHGKRYYCYRNLLSHYGYTSLLIREPEQRGASSSTFRQDEFRRVTVAMEDYSCVPDVLRRAHELLTTWKADAVGPWAPADIDVVMRPREGGTAIGWPRGWPEPSADDPAVIRVPGSQQREVERLTGKSLSSRHGTWFVMRWAWVLPDSESIVSPRLVPTDEVGHDFSPPP